MREREQANQETELDHVNEGRRRFLGTSALAGAGAAAAGLAGAGPAEAQTFPPEPTTRYQVTPHVERFYALNRL